MMDHLSAIEARLALEEPPKPVVDLAAILA